MLFMRSLNGSPERDCQAGAKDSYVGLDRVTGAVVGPLERPVLRILDDSVDRDVGRVDDARHGFSPS